MKSELFQAICRMGIFVICAQSIVHFRPKASYEKYLKMLVSIMVLIQIFLPVGHLVFGNGKGDLAARAAEFEQNMEEGMAGVRENVRQSEEKLEQMTLKEVNRRLAEAEREKSRTNPQPKQSNAEKAQDKSRGDISVELAPVEIEPIGTDGQKEQGDA